MFHRGETVRDRNLCFGEVIVTGENPWVGFIGGLQRQVARDTLRVVPHEVLDATIENLELIEAWLDRRIYGVEQSRPRPLPRPEFGLEAAMTEPVLPLPPVRHDSLAPALLYFEGEATVVSDLEAAANKKPIRVTAVHVDEHEPSDSLRTVQ